MDKIRTDGKRFVDSLGRERIFNGVNVVDKSTYREDPGKYGFAVTEDVVREFAEKGIDLLRLGFTWNKLEPHPGRYNDEYLASVSEIIDLCERYGIYVYLDMHQDLYSSVCCGDGAPEWATLTNGFKPRRNRLVWAENYFISRACHTAFDNFWNNTPFFGKGLQDYFADCWCHVISVLGHKDAVIGFDLFNEPFPGTDGGKAFRRLVKKGTADVLFTGKFGKRRFIKNLFSENPIKKILDQVTYPLMRSVTSGADELIYTFDTQKYAPFLSKMAKAIRQTGNDKILFMENSYYSNTGIPFSAPRITVDGTDEPQQAFTPHAYDLMVDTPLYKYACDERVYGIFSEHKRSQDRLGVPVIVGEWGGFGSDDDECWTEHIKSLLRLFDKYKWSNTYWVYYDGFFDSPLMKVFVRPHPHAVNGVIEEYAYDSGSRRFCLLFESEKEGETEIYVHTTPGKVLIDGEKTDAPVIKDGHILTVLCQPGKHCITVEF